MASESHEPHTLATLARKAELSSFRFLRAFKAAVRQLARISSSWGFGSPTRPAASLTRGIA
jgi:hypothetical protein